MALASTSFTQLTAVPLSTPRTRSALRRAPHTCVAGLFDNFGKSTDAKRDAEFKRQQEVLRARRAPGNKAFEAAEARRAEVSRYMKLSKDEQRKYRERNPDNSGSVYEDEKKEGAFSRGLFILPIAPFGDPKMDGGERWDLKAKYTVRVAGGRERSRRPPRPWLTRGRAHRTRGMRTRRRT